MLYIEIETDFDGVHTICAAAGQLYLPFIIPNQQRASKARR